MLDDRSGLVARHAQLQRIHGRVNRLEPLAHDAHLLVGLARVQTRWEKLAEHLAALVADLGALNDVGERLCDHAHDVDGGGNADLVKGMMLARKWHIQLRGSVSLRYCFDSGILHCCPERVPL